MQRDTRIFFVHCKWMMRTISGPVLKQFRTLEYLSRMEVPLLLLLTIFARSSEIYVEHAK